MTLTLFKLKRLVKLGVRSLYGHKLRSFLTALGIIFGVSSVIAMLAIGEGASYEAREQIRRLGSNNIIVRARKPPESTASAGKGRQMMSVYGLTYADAHRIKVLFPQIRVHVPARIMNETVRRGRHQGPAEVIGTVPWFIENAGLTVSLGRFLVDADIRDKDNVCVIDHATARKLFPLSYPIAQSLFLGRQPYRVVGVVAAAEQADDQQGKRDVFRVYVPMSTARKRFGEVLAKRETGSFKLEKVELHRLTLTAPSTDAVMPLANSVRTLLRTFHKKNDFEIVIPLELLKQAEETKRIFNIVLGSIAAISLLVGGIGIMNIMLASVTERTREIGIRRALGATRSDIVLQFLAEALLLSIAGGILGTGLGLAIPAAVEHFASMRTIIRTDSLFLAFGISVLTGIVFGIYPATRAAALSPIEALRHE